MGASSVRVQYIHILACLLFFRVCGSFHKNTGPQLLMAFSSASIMSVGSCSYLGESMWFWADVPAVCESNIGIPQPLSCQVCLRAPQKQVNVSATGVPYENCSLMNKTHILLVSFCPLPFFFCFLCPLWDTTLCECRKIQRYPCRFFSCVWLIGCFGCVWIRIKLQTF